MNKITEVTSQDFLVMQKMEAEGVVKPWPEEMKPKQVKIQGKQFKEIHKGDKEWRFGNFTPCSAWVHTYSGMRIIATLDETHHGPLLHLSISHPDRYPNWDEIFAAKDQFFGKNIDVMMVMPKEGFYINVHKHCFHLWQTPKEWGLL